MAIKTKDLVSLKDAPPIVEELTGVKRGSHALYYWATAGMINKHGTRTMLKTTKRIHQYYTTREWIKSFLESL